MAYFTDETLKFWNGLAANNSKAWFDDHRSEYEEHLKEPYLRLAADLVAEVRDREPEYTIEPKKAIYRINRDIRFSKDKTPYKTDLAITVGKAQKHDPSYPAYTVRLGIDGISIAGGMYAPENELRDFLRRYIAENGAALKKATNKAAFKKLYGTIGGEVSKRLPKDLAALAETEPLVFNKQWVFWAGYDDPELLLSEDLGGFILDHWDAARPMNEFFKTAVAAAPS